MFKSSALLHLLSYLKANKNQVAVLKTKRGFFFKHICMVKKINTATCEDMEFSLRKFQAEQNY